MDTLTISKDIEIKIYGMYFYCRYCDDIYRCPKHHRNGVYFLCELIHKNNLSIPFIIGDGETEVPPFGINLGNVVREGLSGCVTYERAHRTCGGWYTIVNPLFISHEEFNQILKEKDLEESPFLLDNYIGLIFVKQLNICRSRLVERILQTTKIWDLHEIELGLWSDLLPLLKTFVRYRHIVKNDIVIKEEPYSYKAALVFGNVEIPISKGRYEFYENNRWENQIIYSIHLPGSTIARYAIVDGRKILYLIKEIGNDYNGEELIRVFGYEQYKEHVHSPCEIDGKLFKEHEKRMFTRRLGDLLFLKERDCALKPASEESFNKIIGKENIKLDEQNNVYYINAPVVLYHPEHGGLILDEANRYWIYEVPYVIRGHD